MKNEEIPQKVPWFWSDQYDCKLQIVGISLGATEIVIRGDINSKHFSVFYFKEGLLIAVDSVNQARDHLLGRKLVPLRLKIDNPSQLGDSNFNLKNLLPAIG